MPKYIMLLNDGETYTDLNGCSIVSVPDHLDMEETEDQLKALSSREESELTTITVFQNPS